MDSKCYVLKFILLCMCLQNISFTFKSYFNFFLKYKWYMCVNLMNCILPIINSKDSIKTISVNTSIFLESLSFLLIFKPILNKNS